MSVRSTEARKRPQPGRRRSLKERGVIIILTAITLLIMLPVAGLAIDAAVMYAVKARLQSAVDASSIAAARTLNVGMTLEEQIDSARNRAYDFFDANFPIGTWGSKDKIISVDVAETGYKTRTVTVTASVDIPQMFMQMLGFKYSRVASEGKASRRDVNLILILDRSGSMKDTSTVKPCSTMKTAAKNFIDMFTEGRDRLGIVTFSTHSYTAFAPSMSFKSGSPTIYQAIDNITCDGWTSSASALNSAYTHLKNINEAGALNLIVFFTDGVPTGVTGSFPIRMKTDTRYGYPGASSSSCNGTNELCSHPPSPCRDAQGDQYDRNNGASSAQYFDPNWNPNWTPTSPLTGVIAGGGKNPPNLGTTQGIYKIVGGSQSEHSGKLSSNSYCSYQSNVSNMRRDVAYIPTKDSFGNDIDPGYKTTWTRFTSGEYNGKIRPDYPKNVTWASVNSADSQAKTIREDATYKPIIYAIGLGDVDDEFLLRASNDPASPIHTTAYPDGLYVYAQTVNDMNEAFLRVASEILRIAK